MQECPNLAGCGFIEKYSTSKSLAVKGFIALYCKGSRQGDCKRKQFKAETGQKPPDDMMPNGGSLQ